MSKVQPKAFTVPQIDDVVNYPMFNKSSNTIVYHECRVLQCSEYHGEYKNYFTHECVLLPNDGTDGNRTLTVLFNKGRFYDKNLVYLGDVL